MHTVSKWSELINSHGVARVGRVNRFSLRRRRDIRVGIRCPSLNDPRPNYLSTQILQQNSEASNPEFNDDLHQKRDGFSKPS